jgi:hypothetical protein
MEYLVRFVSAVGPHDLGFPGFGIDHQVAQFVPLAYKAFVRSHRCPLVHEVSSKLESLQISLISPESPLLYRRLDL